MENEFGTSSSPTDTQTILEEEEPYWQVACTQNMQKWSYMLDHNLYTDMQLTVGKGENMETIKCHRIMLFMHSPVIETMFSERWGQETCFEWKLPDFEPSVCHIILKFLYTEELEMPTASLDDEDATQNLLDTCLSILRFASMYCIPALKSPCHAWIINTEGMLNENTVLQIYSHAVLYSDNELQKISLNLISGKTLEVCESPSFQLLSLQNLCQILKVNDLSISEFELFQAVCRWAEAECVREDQDVTPENMRIVLKEALYLIRFPAIPPDVFATKVLPIGVLSLEARVEILSYFSLNKEQKQRVLRLEHFETKPRCFVYTLKRFESMGSDTFDYSKNWRNLVFEVSHPINIVSLGFYGPGMPEAAAKTDYIIKIRLSCLSQDIPNFYQELERNVTLEPHQRIFHVKLPAAIEIQNGTSYNISFMLLGPRTLMGDEIRDCISIGNEHHGEITFNFREAQFKNNRYQIPEICFTVQR